MTRKEPKILVIGGGINGRMVQHVIPSAKIYDWGRPPQDVSTPKFYGANYLWEPIPGIPCHHREVFTTIDGVPPTPEGVIRYKKRVGKVHELEDMNFLMTTQFQAKMDGWDIVAMPPARITYNAFVNEVSLRAHTLILRTGEIIDYDYLVSTIPLPSFLGFAGWSGLAGGVFRSAPVRVRIEQAIWSPLNDHYILWVNYNTDPSSVEYRSTYRDSERHDETLDYFIGEGTFKRLMPGKIWDTPQAEEYRDKLAFHDVYCFGRYGAWRSDELVHQTVKNIRVWAETMGFDTADYEEITV